MLVTTLILLSVLAVAFGQQRAVQNLTPQMGWNSWNKFACNISETLIKETADALVSSGLADLGYNYLNLDDCWHAAKRDSTGKVQADADRFPSGLKALGDYIHSKGLKFGIYSSAGFKTCQGFPASLGLEEIDAASYNEWGVDYLKYDNCFQDHGLPEFRYKFMANALRKTGRDIFYSLCEWGRENPAAWASEIGANSWRISGDIRDEWRSIISRAEIGASLWRYAGPNRGWNDPDMLEVGNGGCTETEYRTHFSLWAMLKSPLIVGNDIRGLDTKSEIFQILANKEVIAVNQDALGAQGRIVWSDVSAEILPALGHGSRIIAAKCATGAAGEEAFEDPLSNQEWEHTSEGFLRNKATNLCLREHPAILPAKLTEEVGGFFNVSLGLRSVDAAPCDKATAWDVEQIIGGAIVSRESKLCLEVSRFEMLPVIQGKRVQTAPCHEKFNGNYVIDIQEHQSWTAPATRSLLNLYQRQCLTVDRDAYPGLMKEIWLAPLSGGDYVVLLLNKSRLPLKMSFSAATLGLQLQKLQRYRMRDLWKHDDLLQTLSADNEVSFFVEPHGVVLLRLSATH